MGLGKTLQAVSLMSYLKVRHMSPGPFCKSVSFFFFVLCLYWAVLWLSVFASSYPNICSGIMPSECHGWLGIGS